MQEYLPERLALGGKGRLRNMEEEFIYNEWKI